MKRISFDKPKLKTFITKQVAKSYIRSSSRENEKTKYFWNVNQCENIWKHYFQTAQVIDNVIAKWDIQMT